MGKARALAELQEVRRQNPLAFYRPHPKQEVFHRSRLPLRAFLGGNRSGKTTAGVVDDLVQAVDRSCLPDGSGALSDLRAFKKWEPPFFCRVMAPDFVATMEGVVFPKFREWAPLAQLLGGSFDRAYDKQRRMLWFENGSWFQFLTYEQDVDKLGGAALHRIHYDEEPPRGHRQESLMRLIDFGGEELFTMTPLMGMTWLFGEVYEPWERGELDECLVVTVDMDDNPHLDERTKTRVLSGLSEEERQARKQGRFVHFAGLIYPEFDRSRHVIPQGPVPFGAQVYVGIDPGLRHMAAVDWLFVDFDGRQVVFDELSLKGATIEQVCKEIQIRNALHEAEYQQAHNTQDSLIVQWYVIDPASRNRNTQSGRSDQSIFVENGIPTILGQNAVTAGITRVKALLEHERAFWMANCRVGIDQHRLYRWASPNRTGENAPPESPVKKDDHHCDTRRYLAMSLPFGGDRPQTREPKEVRRSWLEHDLKSSQRQRISSAYGPGIYA